MRLIGRTRYPGSLVSQSVMFLCDDGEPSGPNVVFLDSSVDTNLYNASSGQLINGVDAHVDALAEANKALVERGFIVRTGLERLNVEAYFDYTYKRTQFAASGAQYLMTYNEVLPTLFPTTYQAGPSVMFGGKAIGKCNPVTSSKYCKITKG
ncbi:hypothetical protein CEUSTIGMA_g7671.t1 [Chlamydomonas eustigma]|uniref:Uncharacterized protein n=1 Tax=Chlamydomonas eustigma TaxID=1157962 RepID=A0A250XAT9_9CHLO|nr:hypothetical protein CEUSTIGMA_g7671.t1 [Chlamydomonas eustigma]|eukprot:GAX80233.1 hypothetical protein CEUSTIGMA_g7671.t1 [Chlamydomonas eustigma]